VPAHWRHLANTIEHVLSSQPTQVHNPNGKSIGSAVLAQSPDTYSGLFFPPEIAASDGDIWTSI